LLVGNDVVDLRDPENQPSAIHPRFDERVFTPAERARLTDETTAHRTRWLMWAAKESAFKVARKLDGSVRFLPRQFGVQLEGKARAVVRHAAGRFRVSFSGAEEWVHAIAERVDGIGRATPSEGLELATPRGPSAMIERVRQGGLTTACPSVRVRAMARSVVGPLFSIAPPEIEISTLAGVPVALWRGRRLPVDLSFSHHGRFLACAWSRSRSA
jgi:phosphopantetheinyl transferase (holo-ACP synthase)